MRFPSETTKGAFLGLDLGQRRDYTAIAAIAVTDVILGQEPVAYNFIRRTELRIVHLARIPLGSPYSELPSVLHRVVDQTRHFANAKPTLAVDATGPGTPVIEMIRNAGLDSSLLPAIITGGESSARKPVNGVYSVARKDLLSILRVAIETGRLKGAPSMPLKDELLAELRTLEAESASHARNHDDLVFAVALALWAAKIRGAVSIQVD